VTVRVAVAEVRTAVYRALVVRGATSGEAETAAEACARAEIDGFGGVAVAVEALERMPVPRVGAQVEAGSPAVLVDPGQRPVLLRARMALDWLGAHPDAAIALPDVVDLRPVVGSLPHGTSAIAFAAGRAERGIAVTAAGAIVEFEADGGTAAPTIGDGIVLLRAEPTAPVTVTADEREARRVRAHAEGLTPPREAWAALMAVADAYLVPESG
jgi:hypothetical protein